MPIDQRDLPLHRLGPSVDHTQAGYGAPNAHPPPRFHSAEMRPYPRQAVFLFGFGAAILCRTGPEVVVAVEHQVDYNPLHNEEYCYNESTEMGKCLGKERQNSLNKYTAESMMRCLECGETVRGDESCDELKALNDIEDAPSSGLGEGGEGVVDLNNIDWHESFCEQYTECVELYCPKQCHHAQARFMDCVVIELSCDIRCKDWKMNMDSQMMGDRMIGMNNSSKRNHGQATVLGILAVLARIAG